MTDNTKNIVFSITGILSIALDFWLLSTHVKANTVASMPPLDFFVVLFGLVMGIVYFLRILKL